MYGDIATRFWAKVAKGDGCWLWTAAVNHQYGRFAVRSDHLVYAHRVSWELHFGPIPDRLMVLHRCDVPLCVRPDHLFLGTAAENTRDAINKGRMHRGERSGPAILTEQEVRSIRALEGKMSRREIGALFGTSPANVGDIIRRKHWRHVA